MEYSEIGGRDLRPIFIGGGARMVCQALKQVLGNWDIQVKDLPYSHTRLGRWAEEQSQLMAWPLCDWDQMDKGQVLWVYDASPSRRGEELQAVRKLRVMHYLRNGSAHTICIVITILGKAPAKLVESWGLQAFPLELPSIIRFLIQGINSPSNDVATSISADEFKASLAALTHCLKNPELWDEHREGLITLFRVLEADCEHLGIVDGKALCRDSISYWERGSNSGQADLRRRWGIFHSSCIKAAALWK